jgi:hypothetical protein
LKLQDAIRRKHPGQLQEATASSWQYQTPYSKSNPAENSRTTVGTSWTSALDRELGP